MIININIKIKNKETHTALHLMTKIKRDISPFIRVGETDLIGSKEVIKYYGVVASST